MSYQEKRTIFSIVSGILILAAYCIYSFGRLRAENIDANDLKFWAGTILIFIGIGIVVTIIIQIVFHILYAISLAIKEKMQDGNCDDKTMEKTIEKTIQNEMVTDEMDKLIELKSMRGGFFIAGAGFMLGLLAMVLNYSSAVMLNIMFLSFSVGSLVEGFTQLYYYRKGV